MPADPGFDQLAGLFHEARRLDPGHREAFLRERCPDDLREELARLLQAHDERGCDPHPPSPPWVEAALIAWNQGADAPDLPAAEIEGFRLLRRIATGGMGAVYEAEQEHPRRRVAIKMMRPEAATSQGLRRFELEAEALARLHHPGIAQIHLFGTARTAAGQQPFLAMELVDGVSLARFAGGLDLRARVELIAKVADAVMHAHLNGVIHRDLKPSNILVTPDGQPKVLDFGIARLADVGATMHTGTGQVLGTLAYMSPEQLEGDLARVDARSDVYALGVIAYEVLCGRLPHAIEGLPLPAAMRRVLDDDPPRPETLDRRLKGDLSAILLTALAREPERRYQSAGAFAEDLRCYLRDETVQARAPTAGYQLRKFVRRHRALVLGVQGTILALAAGLVLAIHLARRERAWRLTAEQNAEAERRASAQTVLEAVAADLRVDAGSTARRRLEGVPADLRGWAWRYLFARTDTSLTHVRLPGSSSRSLVFGPAEGAPLLVLHPDGPALVDASKGVATAGPAVAKAEWDTVVWAGPTPFALARLPGRILLVRADTGEARDLPALRELETFVREIQTAKVTASAGTADGTRIVLARSDWLRQSQVDVRDARSGAEVASWTGDPVIMSALAFSPDGRLVAQSGWNHDVQLREASTGRLVHRLEGHTAVVHVLAFTPDGRHLASASADRTVRLWRVEEGTALHALSHAGEVTALAFDAGGERLLSGASDGAIRVWSVALGLCERVLLGHEEAVLSLSVGRAGLRSAGADGVRTWPLPWGPDPDVLTYHRTRAEGNPYPYVYAVKFSPDGSMLASGGWDRTARLVEMDTLDLRTTIETGSDYVFDLAYAPDGRRLVGGDAKLFLWEPATGRKVAEWIAQGRNPLCSFAFGRDNRHVVAGDSLGRVLVFRGDGLELVTTWEGHEGKVQDLALSPDGARLASVAADGVCLIRSFPGGEVRHRLRSDAGGTWGVAFDGGGRRVATVGTDGIVRVWDTDNGAELLQLAGHTDRIYAVAFHPDGRLLASGSNDNTIRLWDLERGSEVASLLGHRSYVYGLDFSPDGTTLASASGDNTVRLWSTRTMAERHARALEARARKAGR